MMMMMMSSCETRDDGWRNMRGACRYAHIHTRSDTRAGVGQPHLVHSTDGLTLRCNRYRTALPLQNSLPTLGCPIHMMVSGLKPPQEALLSP